MQNMVYVVLMAVMMFAASWAMGSINILQSIMIADCVDYEEYKNGVRTDGVFFSGQSFITKLAMGVSSLISGFIYSAVHYTAEYIETLNLDLAAGKYHSTRRTTENTQWRCSCLFPFRPQSVCFSPLSPLSSIRSPMRSTQEYSTSLSKDAQARTTETTTDCLRQINKHGGAAHSGCTVFLIYIKITEQAKPTPLFSFGLFERPVSAHERRQLSYALYRERRGAQRFHRHAHQLHRVVVRGDAVRGHRTASTATVDYRPLAVFSHPDRYGIHDSPRSPKPCLRAQYQHVGSKGSSGSGFCGRCPRPAALQCARTPCKQKLRCRRGSCNNLFRTVCVCFRDSFFLPKISCGRTAECVLFADLPVSAHSPMIL